MQSININDTAMKTKKLYSEDAYQQECDSVVVEVMDIPKEFLDENEDGQNRILVLDKTVFYALSGGQPGDTGQLTHNGQAEAVVDTRYKSDKKLIIYHYLESPTTLKPGDTVHCKIDWDRRYRFMRLHSFVHISSMVFDEMYGKQEFFGSNISDRGRYDAPFFDEIDIETLTLKTQKLIDEDHTITTSGDPENEVKRVWHMDPLGDMPCGGTHPRSSGEIGKIRHKRKNLSGQGQRVYCILED
jgi:Ser-tRNA(Ala) deacylase AlaX